MQIEGGDVACIAVLIAGECVDGVGVTVGKSLRGLEGGVGNKGCIVGDWDCKVTWSAVLQY